VVTLREKAGSLVARFGEWLSRGQAEVGTVFSEVEWAKWGIKPYFADDLLRTKGCSLKVYRDMMRDPAVKAGVYNRVFPVMATDWDVRPANYDARRRSEEDDPDVEAAEFVRWNLARLPRAGTMQLFFDLSQALVDGFAVVEIVLEAVTRGQWVGKVGLKALKAKDVETWDFDVDSFLNVQGLKQQVLGKWEPRERERFIVFSWLPRFSSPLGQSEFRAAYRAFWLKDTAWKFRAIYAETIAKGRRKVTYPAEQGEAGRKNAEKLLERLQESLGFAVPSDLSMELLEMTLAPQAVFESLIADCDKEIILGLTGATLQVLEGAETGAFRATETHRKTSHPWVYVFGKFLAAAIQEDLVAPLHALNFALEEAPLFYWRWVDEGRQGESETLERFQRMGLKIPAWYVREKFDVPAPEEDDEILEPAPAVPGMGAIFSNRGVPVSSFSGTAPGQAAEFADPTGAERRALEKVPAAQRALARTILDQVRRKKA